MYVLIQRSSTPAGEPEVMRVDYLLPPLNGLGSREYPFKGRFVSWVPKICQKTACQDSNPRDKVNCVGGLLR